MVPNKLYMVQAGLTDEFYVVATTYAAAVAKWELHLLQEGYQLQDINDPDCVSLVSEQVLS